MHLEARWKALSNNVEGEIRFVDVDCILIEYVTIWREQILLQF